MQRIGFFVGLLAFLGATQAEAQGWQEFISREDRFVLSFPGVPAVEETEWIDVKDETRPAHHLGPKTEMHIMEGSLLERVVHGSEKLPLRRYRR